MTLPKCDLNLDASICRLRQQRLKQILAQQKLEAALIGDRRHVFYFTGYWCRPSFTPLVLIQLDGPTILSAPSAAESELAADQFFQYQSNRLATQIEDQSQAAIEPLIAHLPSTDLVGSDCFGPLELELRRSPRDLRHKIWKLRRAKDSDELAIIRLAIAATEAAYRAAQAAITPGITEVEIFSLMHAAATKVVGEPIGELGNDFQFNSPGGLPRRRPANRSEIAILDVSVSVRGYHSDLSRCFVVGRSPSELQQRAWERIIEVLELAESMIRPGQSCRELFQTAHEMLEGYNGWKFFHHLGHGIGLSPHESPRLNPHWNDTFQIGDVFTLEPGLYGNDLHAGLRIEDNYYLAETGVEKLSYFPLTLL